MKISAIQMNVKLGMPDENFAQAEALIRRTMQQENPDVVMLPEMWNIGFFPKENLEQLSDQNGERTRREMGALAKELHVNIVAGSVANMKNNGIYNTAFVFDRDGACVAEYDKTHLFTPMGEHEFFQWGDHLSMFELDGVKCGIIICYDARFCELPRTMALKGMDVLFIVSQWPTPRIAHIQLLAQARAVENQMFVAYCNACGVAGETVYAGRSRLVDPWGTILADAGESEEVISAEFDLGIVKGIRESINVFRDRKPELYDVAGEMEG